MVPEVLGDEVVNKRVHAAVEAGQAQGGDVKPVHVVDGAVQEEGVVHQQHDVTGSEADQEHHQDCDDQDHSLLALLGKCGVLHAVPESLQHEDVGDDAHNSGNNKSQCSHGQEISCSDLLLTGPGDVVAGLDFEVWHLHSLIIHVERKREEPDHHPDGDGNKNGNTVSPLLRGQRVDHGPVTLHAYAGDERNGAVHVAIKEGHQHFAQTVSIDPVVAVKVVRYFQRDPDNKQQVSQS